MQLRHATLALFIFACAPEYVVLRQSNPNVLHGQSVFFVDFMRWENTRVGLMAERDWLAGKSQQQRASYAADKRETDQNFFVTLSARLRGLQILSEPRADAFTIRPYVLHWEPGSFGGPYSNQARLDLRIELLDPHG